MRLRPPPASIVQIPLTPLLAQPEPGVPPPCEQAFLAASMPAPAGPVTSEQTVVAPAGLVQENVVLPPPDAPEPPLPLPSSSSEPHALVRHANDAPKRIAIQIEDFMVAD
jgi:hypothetical protein